MTKIPATQALYYEDNRLAEFTARVLSAEPEGQLHRVELNRTCFYPGGGGQPADRGTLNERAVLDVRKREGRIFHYLHDPFPDREARGEIDWPWRFHFMQQHTGQHIISGCFARIDAVNTVSVHLGEETTTVEVDAPEISEEKTERIEEEANGVVRRNLPIESRWVDASELSRLSLRRPTDHSGAIRIVEIPGFDRVACGGVHVSETGKVGLIAYAGRDQIRGRVRLHWKIGNRAMKDYRMKSVLVNELAAEFSARPEEIVLRVRTLKDELKSTSSNLREAEERIARVTAEGLLAEARKVGSDASPVVVTGIFHGEGSGFLKRIAACLSEQPGVAFCAASREADRLLWCMGSGPSVSIPFDRIRTELLPLIDGKGGGKPPIYQGVGTRTGKAEDLLLRFAELVRGSD